MLAVAFAFKATLIQGRKRILTYYITKLLLSLCKCSNLLVYAIDFYSNKGMAEHQLWTERREFEQGANT